MALNINMELLENCRPVDWPHASNTSKSYSRSKLSKKGHSLRQYLGKQSFNYSMTLLSPFAIWFQKQTSQWGQVTWPDLYTRTHVCVCVCVCVYTYTHTHVPLNKGCIIGKNCRNCKIGNEVKTNIQNAKTNLFTFPPNQHCCLNSQVWHSYFVTIIACWLSEVKLSKSIMLSSLWLWFLHNGAGLTVLLSLTEALLVLPYAGFV